MFKKIFVFILTLVMVISSVGVVNAKETSYESVLFYQDFSNCATLTDAGLTEAAGWSIGTGSTGTTCMLGTGDWKKTFFGDETWSDYTLEMKFKIISTVAGENIGPAIYARYVPAPAGQTTIYSRYFKYDFRSTNATNLESLIGYWKPNTSNASNPPVQSTTSGGVTTYYKYKGDSAKPQANTLQTLKLDIRNSADGNTAFQKPYLNGQETMNWSQWNSNGGNSTGKLGFEFYGVNTATYEVYEIKVTGKRKFNINFTEADGATAITDTIPSSSTIKVSGNLQEYVSDKTEFLPTVFAAIYKGDQLYDVAIKKFAIGTDEVNTYDLTLNTPQDTSDCRVKAMLWNSIGDMVPLADAMIPEVAVQ